MKTNKKTTKSGKKKQLITKGMSFAEILRKHPEAAEVFSKYGMHCFGCPMSMQESLESGIKAHGLDVAKILNELNKAVKKK